MRLLLAPMLPAEVERLERERVARRKPYAAMPSTQDRNPEEQLRSFKRPA